MKSKVSYVFISVFCLIVTGLLMAALVTQNNAPITLNVTEKNIIVNGKTSRVFDIRQPDGTFGYVGEKGKLFNVIVNNKTSVPLVLHWHGIIAPNPEDGVPYVTQLPIPPGGNYQYQFLLKQAGTFWFHSHYKLQEQKLMAAPLIIHDPAKKSEKEALMFIQDFTFENPTLIYEQLRSKEQSQNNNMPMNNKMNMNMDMSKMPMDLTDVKFDAYLTNHKTLANPDVIIVKANETVLLRIINASASSNYYIDLGKLTGTLVAVDGEDIQPVTGKRFQIAIGNRLDIRIKIPDKGSYPILALPEGTKQQTGLILTTENTNQQLPQVTTNTNPALNDQQDLQLKPMTPLATKPITKTLVYNLEGDMQTYKWTMNGQEWPFIKPYVIDKNDRVALVFNNKSGMSHPMHFHGHVFQIVEINGKAIIGRLGDTVNVMPNSSVKVIFDADNPGIWMLHCHILYHQQGGMMTTIDYSGYPEQFTPQQRKHGESIYNMTIQ